MASRHVVVARVSSKSNPSKAHSVSCNIMNEHSGSLADWECGCTGWTMHVPRRDCSHIKKVKMAFNGAYASSVNLTDEGRTLKPIYAVVTALKQPDEA